MKEEAKPRTEDARASEVVRSLIEIIPATLLNAAFQFGKQHPPMMAGSFLRVGCFKTNVSCSRTSAHQSARLNRPLRTKQPYQYYRYWWYLHPTKWGGDDLSAKCTFVKNMFCHHYDRYIHITITRLAEGEFYDSTT